MATSSDVFQSIGAQHTNARRVKPHAAENGQVVAGLYRLEDRLGRGGMGEVWKAYSPAEERHVAIKFVPPELAMRSEEMQGLKQAFRHIHDLNHQSICPVYGLFEDRQLGSFVVMKYLDAITLSEYRSRFLKRLGSFPLKDVVRVLKPVADALDYAHVRKVIHRDIKPQNIMLTEDGENVQVIDFGLATEIRTRVTRVSRVRMDSSGTYPYMAPEQLRGQLQDAATDQYALGVVAFELLAGRLPFEAADYNILYRCVMEEPVPRLDDATEATNRTLTKALAKQREGRFASCAEFIAELASPMSAHTAEPIAAVQTGRETLRDKLRQEDDQRYREANERLRLQRQERSDERRTCKDTPTDSYSRAANERTHQPAERPQPQRRELPQAKPFVITDEPIVAQIARNEPRPSQPRQTTSKETLGGFANAFGESRPAPFDPCADGKFGVVGSIAFVAGLASGFAPLLLMMGEEYTQISSTFTQISVALFGFILPFIAGGLAGSSKYLPSVACLVVFPVTMAIMSAVIGIDSLSDKEWVVFTSTIVSWIVMIGTVIKQPPRHPLNPV